MRYDLDSVPEPIAYKLLAATTIPRPIAWVVTQGKAGLNALGFAVDGMDQAKPSASNRVAYRCLDWSERRDHMAGKLPKALLARCLQQGWLRRHDGERALEVTPVGRKHLAGLLPSVNAL